jgi:hypothetical protein
MAAGVKTGGRKKGTLNKVTADVREVAQRYTLEALEALVGVLRDSDSPAAKVAAAREILDRGHGKAPQAIAHTTDEQTALALAGLGAFKWQPPQ